MTDPFAASGEPHPPVLVDGEPCTSVSVDDRGFLYGDGIFETIRVRRGRAPLWDYHWRRLVLSCRRLGLDCPDEAQLLSEIARVAPHAEARVRIVLTRGAGGSGYAAEPHAATTRVVMAVAAPAGGTRQGMTVGLCQTRLGANPALAGIKHLCRLEQVLAASEVRRNGWDEGLMLGRGSGIVEATEGNVLALRAGRWSTPPVDECGVAGVYRQYLLDRGVLQEEPLQVIELPTLQALAICNSVRAARLVGEVAGVVQYRLDEAMNWLADLNP